MSIDNKETGRYVLFVKYARRSVLLYSYGALSSCLYRLFLLSITFLCLMQYVKLLTVHRSPDLQFIMLQQIVNKCALGNFFLFVNTRDFFPFFLFFTHFPIQFCHIASAEYDRRNSSFNITWK